MSDEFKVWLSDELDKRKWSHNKLARQAQISQAAVSSVLSGSRNAGADFCIKVAQAIGESPEKLLRLAGILPPLSPSEDSMLQELMELARTLPPGQRQHVLDYIRFLSQQHQD